MSLCIIGCLYELQVFLVAVIFYVQLSLSVFVITGLCRSSEIFGVSQYVIGRMKYLDDKMFKDLSVTAHKWLPITEVGLSDDVVYRDRGSFDFFLSTLHKNQGNKESSCPSVLGEICSEKNHIFIGEKNNSYQLILA